MESYTLSDDEEDDGPGPGTNKKLKPNDPESEPLDSNTASMAKLPGNKCSFVNCRKSKRDEPSLKHYRFPNNEMLSKQWIVNSGNLTLLKCPLGVLRRKSVCSDHFEVDDFVNPSIRRALKPGTVPRSYTTIDSVLSLPEQEFQSNDALSTDIALVCSETMPDTDNDANVSLHEPEIKVEAIDLTDDPLDVDINPKEKPQDSINPSKTVQCLKPVFLSSPAPKNVAVTNLPVPIILRKVAKPPALLKIPQSVKTFKSGGSAQLMPVQHIIVLNNPITSGPIEGNSQPTTLHFTPAAVQKQNKGGTIEVGVSHSLKNKAGNSGEKSKNQIVNKGSNSCVVKGCTGSATHYFRVPYDEEKIEIWKYCLNASQLNRADLICNQHFIRADMMPQRSVTHIAELKHFAVPSSQKVLVGCCIRQCYNQATDTANMYPIPIWGNYKKWLVHMGDTQLKIKKLHDLQQYRVCQRHFFRPNLHVWHNLIPTLELPTDTEEYREKVERCLAQLDQESPTIIEKSVDPAESSCAYLGCKLNRGNAYFMFYEFSSDYNSGIKWLDACDRQDILLKPRPEIEKFMKNSIGVCFQHKNEMEKKIRRTEMNRTNTSNTVDQDKPVKESGDNNDGPIIINAEDENCDLTESSPGKSYVPSAEYCAFVNCSTFKTDLVKKYRFPADSELLILWTEASGIPKTLSEDYLRTLFVCGKHFDESQYTPTGTLKLYPLPGPYTEFVDSTSHEGNEHWVMKQRKTERVYVPKPPISTTTPASFTAVSDKRTRSMKPGYSVFSEEQDTSKQNTFPLKDAWSSLIPLDENCVVKHCSATKTTCTLYPFPSTSRSMHFEWVKAVENKSAPSPAIVKMYERKKMCEKHFERRFQIGNYMLRADAVPTLHLIEELPDIPNEIKDTSIVWKECRSDIFDTDTPDSKTPHIKGNAILRENSIEFPNINRELRFGKHCPKLGYLKKFPYKVYRMTKKVKYGREIDSVHPGHKIQIHTAIIVDDDDESEKEAIKIVSRIVNENANLVPKRAPRISYYKKKEKI